MVELVCLFSLPHSTNEVNRYQDLRPLEGLVKFLIPNTMLTCPVGGNWIALERNSMTFHKSHEFSVGIKLTIYLNLTI